MPPFEPEKMPPADLDWLSLLGQANKANRAVGTFDGLLYGLPNPNVLLSPLTTQEAVLSSKIEGTQADLQDVFKFEAGELIPDESRRQDIQEIINYRTALRLAEDLLRTKPFCINTLLKLHEVLMDSVRGFDKARGTFRTVQNWIGEEGCSLENAAFVPPCPLNVLGHMNDLEKFWHYEEPDPIIQLGLIHAQFEIIHPFMDGNGRMGRMVIPLFLFEKKILKSHAFTCPHILKLTERSTFTGSEIWTVLAVGIVGSIFS